MGIKSRNLSNDIYVGTRTGRGPSPDLWNSCKNILEYANNPEKGMVYFNDFINGPVAANNQTVSYAGDVSIYTAATSGTTIQCDPTSKFGVLELDTTTDDEGATISVLHGGGKAGGVVLTSGKKLWFEARINTESITNDKINTFCGFAEENLGGAGALITTSDALTDKDMVAFVQLAADGDKLDIVYNTASGGGVTTSLGDAVTLVADTFVKVGIHCDGTYVHFFSDGVKIHSVALSATNFPDGEEMAFYFAMMNKGGDTLCNRIDWVKIAQSY